MLKSWLKKINDEASNPREKELTLLKNGEKEEALTFGKEKE